MRKPLLIVGILLLAFLLGVVVWQGYPRVSRYLQAKQAIEAIPDKIEREEAWREFDGYDPARMYGGVYVGRLGSTIWVYGRVGLRRYQTDEHSVYSWFDGCNPDVLTLLNQGEPGAIEPKISTDISERESRLPTRTSQSYNS